MLMRLLADFTSYMCRRLTGRPGPGWLNRAASIGLAFPCIVPRQWIEPPDYDLADGELLADEDSEYDGDATTERSRMLRSSSDHPTLVGVSEERLDRVESRSEGERSWPSDIT